MTLLCNWNTNVSMVYIICILKSTPTIQNMEMSLPNLNIHGRRLE